MGCRRQDAGDNCTQKHMCPMCAYYELPEKPDPSAATTGSIAGSPGVEEDFYALLDKLLVDIDTLDGRTPLGMNTFAETEPEWWLSAMALRDIVQRQVSAACND